MISAIAIIAQFAFYFCFWHLGDIRRARAYVRFRGKADMGLCAAHVRF